LPYGIATPKTASGKQLAVAIQAAIKTLIARHVRRHLEALWRYRWRTTVVENRPQRGTLRKS